MFLPNLRKYKIEWKNNMQRGISARTHIARQKTSNLITNSKHAGYSIPNILIDNNNNMHKSLA